MNEKTNTLHLASRWGITYTVAPHVGTYLNNNLYVGLASYDHEFDFWEPFTDVTVNIAELPYLFACIDTNNNGEEILDFLEKNGFGECTAMYLPSGFCSYPVFCFNEERLKEFDPDGFAEYAKCHGKEKSSLDKKIKNADAKTVKSEHAGNEQEQER